MLQYLLAYSLGIMTASFIFIMGQHIREIKAFRKGYELGRLHKERHDEQMSKMPNRKHKE